MNRPLRSIGILLATTAISRAELISYDCNFVPEEDPTTPWVRVGTFVIQRWVSEGSFFQELIQGQWPWPHGEDDYYHRFERNQTGNPTWYLEWKGQTDGLSDAFAVNAPSVIATADEGPSWYHFTFAANQLRIFHLPSAPYIYVDLAPQTSHVFRLEIEGVSNFRIFVDGEMVDSGTPPAPYPTGTVEVVWGARYYRQEHTSEWHYIRYGGPIPDAGTGDFDTNGSIDLRDFFFFTEYLTGPDTPHAVGWAVGDMEPIEGDGDIELADFAAFQNGFTGPA